MCAKKIYNNDVNSIFGLKSDELVQEKLLENYTSIKDARKQEWFINERFNTHNQFIHEFLSHGFLSVILLILILTFLIMHTVYYSYGFITALVFFSFLFLPNIKNQD